MPVLIYLIAVMTTIVSSAYGVVALATIAGFLAAVLVFRHELRGIRLPVEFWRTEP